MPKAFTKTFLSTDYVNHDLARKYVPESIAREFRVTAAKVIEEEGGTTWKTVRLLLVTDRCTPESKQAINAKFKELNHPSRPILLNVLIEDVTEVFHSKFRPIFDAIIAEYGATEIECIGVIEEHSPPAP